MANPLYSSSDMRCANMIGQQCAILKQVQEDRHRQAARSLSTGLRHSGRPARWAWKEYVSSSRSGDTARKEILLLGIQIAGYDIGYRHYFFKKETAGLCYTPAFGTAYLVVFFNKNQVPLNVFLAQLFYFQIVVVFKKEQEDYISLTDIAKVRDAENPSQIISLWLRTYNTIEYIGL